MRPLNLIPPEERRGESAPLRAGVLSYVIVGVLAFALIAVVALVLTSNSINDDKSELASLEARSAAAQQTAAGLAPYNDFASLTAARNQTVSSLAQSRFDWQRVLEELALVIPSDVTLTNLSGAATADQAATAAATTGSSAAVTGPSLQLSGCAEGQEGVATLLASLRDIDGVTRVGMQSSALNDQPDPSAGTATATGSGGCEADPKQANFEITVAFDKVPTAAAATGTTGATGATATTPTTTTATGSTPTSASTDDGGAAQTQAEQQGAKDSAANETQKASNAAGAVGAGQ